MSDIQQQVSYGDTAGGRAFVETTNRLTAATQLVAGH
jgi:hypothetical protein